MKRTTLSLLFIFALSTHLFSEIPEWITKIPYADDAFFGVGSGSSMDEAKDRARVDILMQLSSKVEAVISIEQVGEGGQEELTEDLNSYIGSNSLRGAELEDSFEQEGNYWVLLKYCDDCGDLLINSAILRYEEVYEYEAEEIIEVVHEPEISEAVKLERRLTGSPMEILQPVDDSLHLEDMDAQEYQSQDIQVIFQDDKILIRVVNFLPDNADLSESQVNGLRRLSETLLEELEALNYQSVDIIGHANPTGRAGEEAELITLSQGRAETMEQFLSAAGLNIQSVTWVGGDELLGDTTTDTGRGLNRRVEIVVNF